MRRSNDAPNVERYMIKIRNKNTGVEILRINDDSLSGSNLCGADLRGADLRCADLRGFNLQYTNLRFANLRDANLQNADLRNADLKGANLHDANLRDANLLVLLASRHVIYATKSNRMVRIGCSYYTIDYWLENYQDLGAANKYSEAEIAEYHILLQSVQLWMNVPLDDSLTIEEEK